MHLDDGRPVTPCSTGEPIGIVVQYVYQVSIESHLIGRLQPLIRFLREPVHHTDLSYRCCICSLDVAYFGVVSEVVSRANFQILGSAAAVQIFTLNFQLAAYGESALGKRL